MAVGNGEAMRQFGRSWSQMTIVAAVTFAFVRLEHYPYSVHELRVVYQLAVTCSILGLPANGQFSFGRNAAGMHLSVQGTSVAAFD